MARTAMIGGLQCSCGELQSWFDSLRQWYWGYIESLKYFILVFSYLVYYSTQKEVLIDNKSGSNISDRMWYNRHFSNMQQALPNYTTLHNKDIDETSKQEVGKIFIEKQVSVWYWCSDQ